MKLSEKYNRVNLVTSLIVLCLTGVFYYAFVHYILTDKLDKDLAIEEDEIKEYIKTYKKLPLPGDFKDQKVVYEAESKDQGARVFLYTEYFNRKENEEEPGRRLITTIRAGGKIYRVTITKSRVESEDLVRVIFLITLTVTALLLISLLLVNRLMMNRLWRPFQSTLAQMKAFNVSGASELRSEDTDIEEFEELNKAAFVMASTVKQEYKELKSFTDNASHEMMTPLAVVNSKLDILLQTGSFSKKQGELMEDVYLAVGRLSRLNQSLLLLSRMENALIIDYDEVDLDELVRQKTRQFNELIELNQLELTLNLVPKTVRMSRYLADMLLNNLISNAIRHNYPGGHISIQITTDRLTITNTGKKFPLDTVKVFQRFTKDETSEGMGLGLALSKQIAGYHHFTFEYNFFNDTHVFYLDF